MGLPQMWFREIRPSIGEDKKLSKYGIIAKICLTRLREMHTTAHWMMIKICLTGIYGPVTTVV